MVEPLPAFGIDLLRQFRLLPTGEHQIHSDILRSPLQCSRLDQADQSGFGCGISDLASSSMKSCVRSNHDDRSASIRTQNRCDGPHAVKRCGEIRRDHFIPQAFAMPQEETARADPGTTHQSRWLRHMSLPGCDHLANRLRLPEICLIERACTTDVHDPSERGRRCGSVSAVVDADVPADLAKRDTDGPTDASGGACDEYAWQSARVSAIACVT